MGIIKNLRNRFLRKEEADNPNIFFSYYLFGTYEDVPIWHWENWSKCISILQPIIELSPETPFIKTEQSIPITHKKKSSKRLI